MARYRYDPPRPLRELVKDFLDDFPHRRRLKRGMILSLWERIVGERIAREAEDVHFEHGKLVVSVKNPAWRHEIHMKRFNIARKLNEEVGEEIIKEIVVRS